MEYSQFLLFACLSAFSLKAAEQTENNAFVFAAIGCVPYSRVDDFEQKMTRLTHEINRSAASFTVHCGDIIGGDEPASDERFIFIRNWFNSFEAPLIFTPGDNEWTDAHRPAIGGYDPLERLAKLRELFFTEELSMGRNPMTLTTQRSMEGYEKFVENATWTQAGVVFATIHMIGSRNNNQPNITGAVEEYQERDAANIAWLRKVFAEAQESSAPGVALFIQAQPFAYTMSRPGFIPGFETFLTALRDEVIRFDRPVLLIHADEHRYRHEQGVAIELGAPIIPNLIRLGTFGDQDIHGVIVLVDPTSPQVFAPGPLLVPGNSVPSLRRR